MNKIIIAVTLAFSFNSVYANCGNDKNVGNGCTQSPNIVASTPLTNNIGVTNESTNSSRSGAMANSFGGISISSNTNNNQANGGQATNNATLSGGNNTATNTATGGQGGTGGTASAINTAQGGSVQGTVESRSEINVSTNSVNNVPRSPVASAIAPNTIFSGGMDSCMGSSTGSVQGLSLGVSVGTTWTDSHCVALRAAVRLNELGFKNTAAARLCAIPEIKEAFRKSKEFDCDVE